MSLLDPAIVTSLRWTTQQFRTAMTGEAPHRFLIHDRDAIFASEDDCAAGSMGLRASRPRSRRRS